MVEKTCSVNVTYVVPCASFSAVLIHPPKKKVVDDDEEGYDERKETKVKQTKTHQLNIKTSKQTKNKQNKQTNLFLLECSPSRSFSSS